VPIPLGGLSCAALFMTLETLLKIAAQAALFGGYAAWKQHRQDHPPAMKLAERAGRFVGSLLWSLRGRQKARGRG
jgi:hypothetical protein